MDFMATLLLLLNATHQCLSLTEASNHIYAPTNNSNIH